MRVRAEFTTEPFVGEGQMPEHVTHSAALLTEAGLDADLGPFGTSVEGEDTILVPALTNVLAAALAAGATRVTLQLERVDTEPRIDHATTDHTATDHTATDHDGATL
jgi:uncharacterized protein YqgV (UPF0045/DUF77 family)